MDTFGSGSVNDYHAKREREQMSTYYELRDYKDVKIVKEVICGDHLVPVGECGCLL